MKMRSFLAAGIMLWVAAALWAEEPEGTAAPAPASGKEDTAFNAAPALLREAVKKSALDGERWAYTQTVISRDRKGKVEEELVVRNDPSQPPDVQWTPLRINGKEPTEKQIREYRKEHDKRRKSRRTLGELLDLNKATLLEENDTTITYQVPLVKNDNQRLPPEKFQVTVRINKAGQALENVAVRLREAMRMALVVKVKSGEADLDFAKVDPRYAPPIAALSATGEGTILFVKVGGNYSAVRTDFKRVTPYLDRLKVKLGPLQFLDY